jgi:predicted NBD/HSP70 family sugar kinase
VSPLYVGIDIGATHHVVQTMDLRGQLVSRAKVTNALTGVEALVQQLVQAAIRVGSVRSVSAWRPPTSTGGICARP